MVIKDPVLGQIPFGPDDAWARDLLDTREVQRMRFIMQLGATHFIYPGATHTRFSHQLGSFEVARRFIDGFKRGSYSPVDRKVVLAAAMLHDIGHGPSSHSFEVYTGISHEHYSCAIILDSASEVNASLRRHAIDPNAVVGVIRGKSERGKEWMAQLVSSQLDADRLDYLMRDSFYTGTTYGIVDRDFLIGHASIANGRLVFSEKIVSSIENYLMSRYHMYVQVYHSKSAYAWEALVGALMARMRDLYVGGKRDFADVNGVLKLFAPWLSGGQWSVSEFHALNESSFQLLLSGAESENDPVLARLGRMYNRRHNFTAADWSVQLQRRVEKAASSLPDGKYLHVGRHVSSAYIYNRAKGKEIYVLKDSGEIVDVSKLSFLLRSMRLEPAERVLTIFERSLVGKRAR